ncbi:hypothetical protein ACLMJK_009487 [Lecanora helva]
MGQNHSKHRKISTEDIQLVRLHTPIQDPPTPATQYFAHPLPDDITPPAPIRTLTRISEIIDPRDLIQEEPLNQTPPRRKPSVDVLVRQQQLREGYQRAAGIVHSPSGNSMDVNTFVNSPTRPLAMWERQERIRQNTLASLERLELETGAGHRGWFGNRAGGGAGKCGGKAKRRCGCLCFW